MIPSSALITKFGLLGSQAFFVPPASVVDRAFQVMTKCDRTVTNHQSLQLASPSRFIRLLLLPLKGRDINPFDPELLYHPVSDVSMLRRNVPKRVHGPGEQAC